MRNLRLAGKYYHVGASKKRASCKKHGLMRDIISEINCGHEQNLAYSLPRIL